MCNDILLGTIDLSDFLLTMCSLQSEDVEAEKEKGYMMSVHLYFTMFDIYDTGQIELKDFEMVMTSLMINDPVHTKSLTHRLLDGEKSHAQGNCEDGFVADDCQVDVIAGPVISGESQLQAPDDALLIEDMFSVIDKDGDGKVSIEDFRDFYREVVLR